VGNRKRGRLLAEDLGYYIIYMNSIRNNSRFQIPDSRFKTSILWNLKSGIWNHVKNKLLIFCLLFISSTTYSLDLAAVVSGLQRRYASVETVSGSFQQTYRAPGIDQLQSGVFRLKRPALMRWEYRSPEEQLFIADGREAFLYVPSDRQVTIQPLSASDLHNTPLELLMGSADLNKNFSISWETEFKPKTEHGVLIRLTPRANEPAYQRLVLEFDPSIFDLQRIVVCEHTGNTMEFLLSSVITNTKMDNKQFQFKPPKGVEIIRLE
jgi:outer membrane lipoprotein carrier protein